MTRIASLLAAPTKIIVRTSYYCVIATILILFAIAAGQPSLGEIRMVPAANSRDWQPPLPPPLQLSAGFNPPAQKWLAGHRGVDLAASLQTQVVATGAGTVRFVGTIVDRPVISIDHGTVRTTYEPVASSLTVGQPVAAGQIIGTIANGGHCDARCLHWGLIRGETYLDPFALLRTSPPVLKPPK